MRFRGNRLLRYVALPVVAALTISACGSSSTKH